MASDIHMEIDGIKGESTDDKHKDQIEVMSWSWGAANASSMSTGGGGGAGKASFADFSFMHWFDKASPALLKHLALGTHIKKAVLHQRKSGGGQQEFLTITFEDVFVTSVGPSGSGESVQENVSFSFGKYSLDYKPQKKDGSLDAPV
ncbi:MAG: type VI secretion system tube protein Hcp, partial [Betaproteobacteria bacterium]|nr:type VI secretion system tube protein Hcp [Betaproteobacteria bacterium]